MLDELIEKAKLGDSDSMLELIYKFTPLLKKYARWLEYDDAFSDLVADFIFIINTLQLQSIRSKTEAVFISYIHTSVYHSFIRRSKQKRKWVTHVMFSELSEDELYYIEVGTARTDNYFSSDILEAKKVLSEYEYEILRLMFVEGISVTDIAKIRNKSRQAINQAKNRAIKKLIKNLT